MAAFKDEKPSATHFEAIDSTNASDQDVQYHSHDANEDIVRHLQTTGEDVGMTSILTYINADLGPDPRYTWITISWNLGGAMLVTVGGCLSDIFGRRWFFIAGAIILIIGSIVSATGQSINQMIAGGALFGCGSGFLEMAFGAVQEIVPSKYRHVTIGLFDAASIIAQIMPLVSWAIIKQTGNWRICYYAMIGFQTINLALLFFFYNPPTRKEKRIEHGKSATRYIIRAFGCYTVAGYAAIPGVTPAVQAAASLGNKEAYLEGTHLSYLVALAFGCLGVIAAFFIPSVDKRKYTSKTVAVQNGDRKALREKMGAEGGVGA